MEQQFKNVPVLVTGGCGFIGSHLVEKLVKLGAKVTILDNLSTGDINNLASVKDDIILLEDDITNQKACDEATNNQKIVFHLAALTSVAESEQDPATCNAINIDGTRNMLQAAKNHNVQRFIFSSSASVYGNKNGICTEETNCAPISVYGKSKLVGEELCHEFANNGLETVVLRYFNVYGARQPLGSIFANLRHCMLNNLPITIFGHAHKTRDFISVNTVADANVRCAALDAQKVNNHTFNIGSGQSKSLIELINELKQEFSDFNAGILSAPPREGDLEYSCADCSKFQKI